MEVVAVTAVVLVQALLQRPAPWAPVRVRVVLAVRLMLVVLLVVLEHQFILAAVAAVLVMELQEFLVEQVVTMGVVAVEVHLLQTRWVVLALTALSLLLIPPYPQATSSFSFKDLLKIN